MPALTDQLGVRFAARLAEQRLEAPPPVESYSTPRRLTVRVERVADRQTDREETVVGPPVSAGLGSDDEPLPPAIGFARKNGVEVADLVRTETPKGLYLACVKRERGRATIDVLPDVLSATLRDLSFPKLMRWDAFLEDGRGELLFGRPIRWLLYLYGGRVVPFAIRRSAVARSADVRDVEAAAITYGHRFLSLRGRPGRAIKVRSFKGYRSKLAEHFVVLERHERRDRITRQLGLEARRLGGRLGKLSETLTQPLDEVADLVEHPSVIAGVFPVEFLDLPEEVLTTTMVRHQHFFPVVDAEQRLKPAFLAVTNTQAEHASSIARNAERVLTARLRDAQFFWGADRSVPLASRMDRLDTVLFHKRLGSYRAKTDRLVGLTEWIAREAFGQSESAGLARTAAELSKTDLTTDMVREFTELQGTIGGVYAREEGQPEEVWKAIYHHYLPVSVDRDAAPTREELGAAGVTWAALALADKLDTIVGLFSAGEQPTGSRDPFGLRRHAHGVLKILVDLPVLTGVEKTLVVGDLVHAAASRTPLETTTADALSAFLLERVQHLFERRGFRYDEVNAVVGRDPRVPLCPLDLLRRLEALQAVRRSPDFAGLAVLFKRVKNIARELPPDADRGSPWSDVAARLDEPAERALIAECAQREPEIRQPIRDGDYRPAFAAAAALRPAVDRFFTDVFVMVGDERVRADRLRLMVYVRDLILELADISEIVTEEG